MGRWAWCSDSWDFDHDGYADLYIANGMITGPAPARDDLNSFFWRQVIANSPAEPRPNYNYDQGWSAVNELIRADGTWSGFERNVFYANNGDGTFSDVSGAVDLDFIEDCRSFALADFDHDGRLEVVLKTRNSPQLRVLKNVVKDLNPSIAFRLTGKKSNRDAIGARVVVDTGTMQITRTCTAGSGFLAQHSKELHFGLGQTKQTVSATIQWPSGATQTLRDLPVNHRVWIEEGEATPRLELFKPAVNSNGDAVARFGRTLMQLQFLSAHGCSRPSKRPISRPKTKTTKPKASTRCAVNQHSLFLGVDIQLPKKISPNSIRHIRNGRPAAFNSSQSMPTNLRRASPSADQRSTAGSFFFSDNRIQRRLHRDLQHPLSLSVRSASRSDSPNFVPDRRERADRQNLPRPRRTKQRSGRCS